MNIRRYLGFGEEPNSAKGDLAKAEAVEKDPEQLFLEAVNQLVLEVSSKINPSERFIEEVRQYCSVFYQHVSRMTPERIGELTKSISQITKKIRDEHIKLSDASTQFNPGQAYSPIKEGSYRLSGISVMHGLNQILTEFNISYPKFPEEYLALLNEAIGPSVRPE